MLASQREQYDLLLRLAALARRPRPVGAQPASGTDPARQFDPSKLHEYGLTPREMEVLALTVEGKVRAQVGLALGMHPRTVDVHRSNIRKKFGVHTVGALTKAVWTIMLAPESRDEESPGA